MVCWKCGSNIEVGEIYRTSECPECKADLHSCKACSFFSPGNHFDCKESIDNLVTDKERANFCDYFRANKNLNPSASNAKSKAEEAKAAFNSLFG